MSKLNQAHKTWFFKQHTASLTEAIRNSEETSAGGGKFARKLARANIRKRLWEEHRGSKKGTK